MFLTTGMKDVHKQLTPEKLLACMLLFCPVVVPEPLLALASGMLPNLLIVTGWLRLPDAATCGLRLLGPPATCPGPECLLG